MDSNEVIQPKKIENYNAPHHSDHPQDLDGDPPLWKKLLVFINPNSGPGRAHKIFEEQVKPILEEAEVAYDAVVTERANHAMDLLQKEDLSQWRGIVIISGDGLIYEVLNGIFKRPDWEKYISIPIGIIPGGSGNGLARAIAHTLQEPYLENPVLVSTLNVVHARPVPMDLVLIETSLGQEILSFLSIGYGLLADVDKESERLRFMGEMRFTVWALVRLASLRRYRARISYRVADGTGPISPAVSANEMYSKQCDTSEETQHIKRPNQCPPINEDVPDDWIIVEDEFIMIYATYQSYISSDCFFAPKAQLSDGVIWLLMIRSTIGKAGLLQFLLKMSDGSHVDIPGVEMIPVTALRLEPISEGILMVDGEEVPCSTIQGEVLPQAATVMAQ
ncbi:sphingosine kinase 1-like isoform X2 [Oratosquilla oratoria]|uniref:sphingosine kinase 1-like isoform X2 n=1 Tax=Oratosquilla oratoria TaxID=337810 RepID=UPI003F759B60